MVYNNRKGVLGDFLYWFFNIPMAVIVIIVFVVMPKYALDAALQPVELDAAITKEMLFQRMAGFSFPYGTEFSEYHPDKSNTILFLSDKEFGYRISDKNNEFFGNKRFFLDAEVLAGINYKEFIEQRGDIIVDIIYSNKYESFKKS